MRLWLDAQLPPRLCKWLTAEFNVEASTLVGLGLRAGRDEDIFMALRKPGDVVITKDEDFIDLVSRLGPPPQIVWVTCGNVTNSALQSIFASCFARVLDLLKPEEPIVEVSDTVA